MRSRRWRQALGPPLLVTVVAAGLIVPTMAGSAGRRMPRDAARPPVAAAAGTTLSPCAATGAPPSATGTWFRRDGVVDAGGQLTGYRLELGRAGSPTTLELALEPESFTSGPVDGMVLVGSDDGRRSTVTIVDVDRSCATQIFEGTTLVRRAVLDPSGDSITEFRLDRRTRADQGVWRRPLDGAAPSRILEPLPADERIGRVFSTELTWSLDGDHLAVTSCGEAACLTRVVDRASGEVTPIDADLAEVIGIAGNDLVAYQACPWLPCEIAAIDLGTARARPLAHVAGLARLVELEGRPTLVYEDYAASGELWFVGVSGGPVGRIPAPDGLRLVAGSARADGAIELPPGVVAASVSGRLDRGDDPASFVRLTDGRAITPQEVVR